MSETAESTTSVFKPESYRDELNFAEFPIASLSDSLPSDQKTLVFTDEIVDRGRNEKVQRKLTITASDEYGLPTAMDDEVLLGLIQLTNKRGFVDRKINFTRYELLQLMGWRLESKSYDRIEQSLKRWLGVTLYYEKAWWSKQEDCWVDENFHVIDQVTIFDRERRERRIKAAPEDHTSGHSSFLWNEAVFNSFKSGYLKQIDFDLFRELKSAISKRMYRFLDKRFYHRSRLEFDLRNFACEHIGLTKSYHNGELKRKLEGAIKELEEVGYLAELPKEKRFIRKSRGEWSVVLQQAEKGRGRAQVLNATSQDEPLVEALVKRGVTRAVAVSLVKQASGESIEKKLQVFDWLRKHNDKKLSQNPAGYLVKSIQNDYAPPSEYVKAKARSVPSHTMKGNTPVEVEIEKDHFKEVWETLSNEEQEEFEKEALEMTDKFLFDQYMGGKESRGQLFKAARETILRRHYERKEKVKEAA